MPAHLLLLFSFGKENFCLSYQNPLAGYRPKIASIARDVLATRTSG